MPKNPAGILILVTALLYVFIQQATLYGFYLNFYMVFFFILMENDVKKLKRLFQPAIGM